MNPRIQHLDKYATARPAQPDVSVASPAAMPEGLARRLHAALGH